MTLTEIADRVKAIRRIASDDEAAHSAEDTLWQDVLTHISNMMSMGPDDSSIRLASEMARLALETKMITFARWCA